MVDFVSHEFMPSVKEEDAAKDHAGKRQHANASPIAGTNDESQESRSGHFVIAGVWRWVISGILALAIVWTISQFSISTLKPLIFDPTLNAWVHYPNTVHYELKEGIARTKFGRHGIAGIPNIEAIASPKIMIWGDSQVEALQVDDRDKSAQQFTRLWNKQHPDPLTGVGVGQPFFCAADYYYLIPRYEKVIKAVQSHFIVLPTMNDTLPDQGDQKSARFVSQPTPHFEPAPAPAINHRMIHRFAELHLQFLTRARSILQEKTAVVRFAPGPTLSRKKPIEKNDRDSAELDKAWEYLLSSMKTCTTKPIVFVYAPTVPVVEKDQLRLDDPDAALAAQFERKCHEHGIGFINLAPDFVKYHEQTQQFPRGFSNSHPWEGHMNRNGHRIVAERLCAYLEEHQDAIHTN